MYTEKLIQIRELAERDIKCLIESNGGPYDEFDNEFKCLPFIDGHSIGLCYDGSIVWIDTGGNMTSDFWDNGFSDAEIYGWLDKLLGE